MRISYSRAGKLEVDYVAYCSGNVVWSEDEATRTDCDSGDGSGCSSHEGESSKEVVDHD